MRACCSRPLAAQPHRLTSAPAMSSLRGGVCACTCTRALDGSAPGAAGERGATATPSFRTISETLLVRGAIVQQQGMITVTVSEKKL